MGINPKYLTDQWLIAEYRELPMVVGSLRANNWKIKSPVKLIFDLGKGHINWFKTRLAYLCNRHSEVKLEASKRGFKCNALSIDLSACPIEFRNDWKPTIQDSWVIRNRLIEKLTKNKLPITWWRYNGYHLSDQTIDSYLDLIRYSELFWV